ncbi:MAG: hypothetical protein HUU16_13880 [Candidatus Omnitrophica bacterium]|nr:hypothetical protein [Candidatus Omnitrophota bacterium]
MKIDLTMEDPTNEDRTNEDRNRSFSRGRSIQIESDPILVSQAHQTPPPRRKLFNRGVKQGLVQ